jgi:uncharacterized protein (DUF58 family)
LISTPTARAYLFAVIGFAAVALGAAFGSPELVAVGSPFLVLLAVGLAGRRADGIVGEVVSPELRTLETDTVELALSLDAAHRIRRVELHLHLPTALALGEVAVPAVRLGPDIIGAAIDGAATVDAELTASRWGVYELDSIEALTMGTLGLFSDRTPLVGGTVVKVFPTDETLRRLLKPIETQQAYGDLVARERGEGIEYADLREMQAGDDFRHVNWRASARSAGTWVNDRHPERNSDVVLFIDTFPAARRGVEPTLDFGVRAIAALARMHLRRHDRVGLITYGEPVRWLQPGTGGRQRYRILDTLMAARHSRHLYWRGISAIPRQALPPKALIIAVTPLLDDRIISAVADLHGRRHDVAVVEVPAERFLDDPQGEIETIARRIWELRRDTVRRRFARHGVPITRWNPDEPLDRALMEVETFRRQITRTRV